VWSNKYSRVNQSPEMNCPKCGIHQQDTNNICTSCGIVFAKYFKYNPRVDSPTGESSDVSSPVSNEYMAQEYTGLVERLQQKLFFVPADEDPISIAGRFLIFIGMTYLSFRLISASIASNYAGEIFLHAINLPFHEAGHVIFRLFGSFITSLGGTLGQLLMPAILFYHFLFRANNPFGGVVCCWWFGENFIDIAPYINDARGGDLPLIGGNFGHSSPYGFHDWEFILNESGLLQYDKVLAKGSFITGSLIMLAALMWGGTLLYKQFKTTKI
jgi:hypothetical protein